MMLDPISISVILFVYDNTVYVPSRFMPVGCGWPGPVFGPVVLLACHMLCGR